MAWKNRRETIRCSWLMGAAFGLALAMTGGTQTANAQESGANAPGAIKDASPQSRPMMISAFTGIHYGYYAAYGFPLTFGGRFYIPIVHNGFIPSLNDEFGIEVGLDFNITFLSSIYRESTVFGFGFPVDAMWDFHISPSFDAYGKLGFVFGNVFSDAGYGGFWGTFRSSVGMRLAISQGVYFRAEVGWPALLAGFGFAL